MEILGLWPCQAGLGEAPIWPSQVSHRNQLASQSAFQDGKRISQVSDAQAFPAAVGVHMSPCKTQAPPPTALKYTYMHIDYFVNLWINLVNLLISSCAAQIETNFISHRIRFAYDAHVDESDESSRECLAPKGKACHHVSGCS